MITFQQCADFSGLAPNETLFGATPSVMHHSLLSSYLLNLWRGPKSVCGLIVSDIRASLDLGATRRAADLLFVLREFVSNYPEALALSSHERTLEKIWEEPTPDEWRLALRIIAKQVLTHIAGYVDDDQFARDGCQFALDRFEKRRLAPTPRLH